MSESRAKTEQVTVPSQDSTSKKQLNVIIYNPRNSKKLLQQAVSSKYFDYMIIFLVILYTLLIFIYFSLDNKDNAENENIQDAIYIVQIMESIILAVFALEIVLKLIGFGFKEYFKDVWYFFDAIIIFASIVLLSVDLSINNQSFQTISKILRGIFRFLRLFLVFRKVNQFRKIQTTLFIQKTKTPVERLLDILKNLKENVDDNDYIKQLNWSIEMISNNELYKPMFEKDDKEAQNYSSFYDKGQKAASKTTKKVEKEGGISSTNQVVDVYALENVQIKYDKMAIPPIVQTYFYEKETVEARDFRIFEFHDQKIGNELGWLMIYLFQYKNDICQELQMDPKKLFAFMNCVQKGYFDNPYHNRLHAFDVTASVNFFLTSCDFKQIGNCNSLELAEMYISAACHDYQHPGTNNVYEINSRSQHAIKYNDKSPLENHHVSASFFLILKDEYDILENFSKDNYKKFRDRMIQLILATDMSVHFSDLAKLKGRLAVTEFDPKEKDKAMCLDAILHASDISNPFKPFVVYEAWAKRVLQEFWLQGDLEREQKLPISYLCDRYTVNTSKSQIGFIDFIVKPYYETLVKFLPTIQPFLTVFDENKEQWKLQIESYDEKLEILVKQKAEKESQNIQLEKKKI